MLPVNDHAEFANFFRITLNVWLNDCLAACSPSVEFTSSYLTAAGDSYGGISFSFDTSFRKPILKMDRKGAEAVFGGGGKNC